ncbi:MAG: GerMN domain-containing protein [Spirochaetes bacterium]|nr:GerMN domain-containing protein [Spirochaetota bacterium]
MAQQNQNRRKTRKKDFKLGYFFWIALILLVITLFIANHNRMQNVVDSTGLLTLFSRSADGNETAQVLRIVETPENVAVRPAEPTPEPQRREVVLAPESQPEANIQAPPPEAQPERRQDPVTPAYNFRDSTLYFIAINEADGTIQLRRSTRSIKFSNSPLTSTITSLLDGVSSAEISRNYITLIPENTALNRIWVADGTAFMDFNENFLFNSFGREGYIGQLQQIIYSATEFPTVRRIQILIDGKTLNYLGSEGIYIGKPLTRDSF